MIMKNPQSSLPPGFRFHPTDEELILHYLRRKVTSSPLPVSIIAEVDIYKLNPWDLPAKAAFGEKEWYFFSPRDRKYPNGARPNRAAASGYWKATGTDKVIVATSAAASAYAHPHHEKLGVKKALVFYKGKPPKGVKTNWIMHEYRLAESPAYNSRPNTNPLKLKDSSMRLDDWVLCRIYKKTNVSSPTATSAATPDQDQEEEEEEGLSNFHQNETLRPLTHVPGSNVQNNGGLMSQKSSSFSNLLDALDYSLLSSLLSDNNAPQLVNTPGVDQSTSLITYNNNHVDMNDLHMFINGTCNNGSSNCSAQKPPHLGPPSSAPLVEENRLKRRRPTAAVDTDATAHPAKRLLGHCSFTDTATSQVADSPQHNWINSYPFLNQQLLLGTNNYGHFYG